MLSRLRILLTLLLLAAHAVATPLHLSVEHNSLGQLLCEAFADSSHTHGLGCDHARAEQGCCDHLVIPDDCDSAESHADHHEHVHSAEDHWATQTRESNAFPTAAVSPLSAEPANHGWVAARVYERDADAVQTYPKTHRQLRAPPAVS